MRNAGCRETFTEAEYRRLERVASDDPNGYWSFAIACAWATGLKLGAVALLRWDSVDWENGCLKVALAGSRFGQKRLEIPVQPELYECLVGLRELARETSPGSEFVQPDMAQTYNRDRHKSLSCQFGRLCHKAGLGGKSFNALRRTFVRDLVKAGVDGLTIASLTGVTDFRRIAKPDFVPIQTKRQALYELRILQLEIELPTWP